MHRARDNWIACFNYAPKRCSRNVLSFDVLIHKCVTSVNRHYTTLCSLHLAASSNESCSDWRYPNSMCRAHAWIHNDSNINAGLLHFKAHLSSKCWTLFVWCFYTLTTAAIIINFPFCHSMPGASDVRSSCRIVPGLTKEQLALCYRATDVTRAALDGLDLAIRECQSQVWRHQHCLTHKCDEIN